MEADDAVLEKRKRSDVREERHEREKSEKFRRAKVKPGFDTTSSPFVPRDPATLISEKPRMRHILGRDSERGGGRSSRMLPEIEEIEINATDR